MKNYIAGLFILMALISGLAFAQAGVPAKPSTQLDEFSTKKGTLYVREQVFSQTMFGQFVQQTLDFEGVFLYEAGKETSGVKGIVATARASDKSFDSDSATLDLEELDGLIKALAYQIDLASKWGNTDKKYTTVYFTTKSGFQVGFFQKATEQNAFAKAGTKTVFFKISNLASIKSAAENALAALKAR